MKRVALTLTIMILLATGASLPPSQVQASLLAGKATAGLPQSLITDVNAEANILIVLICHADGKKPGSVRDRAVIRKLLKHVK